MMTVSARPTTASTALNRPRPLNQTREEALLTQLYQLYSPRVAKIAAARLLALVEEATPAVIDPQAPDGLWTERDAFLIAYPDHLRRVGESPLRTLHDFAQKRLRETIDGLHLLPFAPSSSDEGFATVNYDRVDPVFGSEQDVAALGRELRLMVDIVANHVSPHHEWFQRWLREDPEVADFFIELPPDTDTSAVTRSRPTPLLQPYPGSRRKRYAWATFGPDQVDLNYANPDVLVAMTKVLLRYVSYGAELLRVDAIGYLWKQLGTSSLHLSQTHALIRLWRTVLDLTAPKTVLVAEVRAPPAEAASYLGDGHNEIQINGQFALPPLVLDAFLAQDASVLQSWSPQTGRAPSPGTTFFNLLGTHDGIGLRPVRGLLSPERVELLVQRVEVNGGAVSRVSRSGGVSEPFELNIGYLDALRDPGHSDLDTKDVTRFLTANAIALALPGIPGIYLPGLIGARNWPQGLERNGQPRAMNRQRYDADTVEQLLADPQTVEHAVFSGLTTLLQASRAEPAFHPQALLEVLATSRHLFGFVRTSLDRRRAVICVHNVSAAPQNMDLDLAFAPLKQLHAVPELIAGAGEMRLEPRRLRVDVPSAGFVWISGRFSR